MEFATCKQLWTLFVIQVTFSSVAAWSYHHNYGEKWEDTYPACRGSHQSPISLPTICEMVYDKRLRPFRLQGFFKPLTYSRVKNNGHTVQVDINDNLIVQGGGLNGSYKVSQFHFHWGSNTARGSEHCYDGIYFPLELHVVSFNMKYQSIYDAMAQPDGLAVLGFWFEVGESDNLNYNPLLDSLAQVKYKDNWVSIGNISVGSLLTRPLTKFYRYKGSLTTPPCHESVLWTIFENRVHLSWRQIQRFRSLYEDKSGMQPLVSNCRPPQPLHSRKVYISYIRDGFYDEANDPEVCAIPPS